VRYHVENHYTVQLRGVQPLGPKRFTFGSSFLLGSGSALQIFFFLFRGRIESLEGNIAAPGLGFLVISHLRKVSVCSLLSVCLLLWRDLADNKNHLSKALGAIKAGTAPRD